MTPKPDPVRAHSRAKTVSPAQRLHADFSAVQVSFSWMGVRKTLSAGQKAQAAGTFGAEAQFISAGKKLLDTSCPEFRAVTSVRNRTAAYWKSVSLPFPEPAIRLIRQDQVEEFNERMTQFRNELQEAVVELDRQLPRLRQAAEERLGSLFDPADYPPTLIGLFSVDWSFPSIEPPDYLRQLSPRLFEQERQRMMARFDEAVALAEQGFVSELEKLVGHLVERLQGTTDGKQKIFRDTAVSNLRDFFRQFRSLNVRSNEQLDELVEMAEGMLQGVSPQKLRESESLRERIASQLSGVQKTLDDMLVDKPRRRVLRPNQAEKKESAA